MYKLFHYELRKIAEDDHEKEDGENLVLYTLNAGWTHPEGEADEEGLVEGLVSCGDEGAAEGREPYGSCA